jgi:simple sugar transport system ATP-binding protein
MRRPDAGEIRVAGKAVRFRSNRDAIAVGIAYVPEDRLAQGLVLEASITDNIALASRDLRLAGGLIDRRSTDAMVAGLIRDLDIKAPDPEAPVSTLSGGNQQRVVIAKWLAREPRVLLLDTPSAGVDVSARAAIYRAIRDVARRGAGVLLISDEIEEVWSNAHRIFVMRAGSLIGPFMPGAVQPTQLSEIVHG